MKISIFLLKIATAIDCHSCVSEGELKSYNNEFYKL